MAKTRRAKQAKKERVSTAKRRAEQHEVGFERTSLVLPEGVSTFALKKPGTYRLEILPYTAGEGNPFCDEGELHYERTYWNHRNIGPGQDSYVCLAKTFNKKCPICEFQQKLRNQGGDEQLIKDLAPKERQLFNVFDHADPDKGAQIWEISFHLFGKLLDSRIRNADDDDGYEFFYFPDEEGFTLRLTADEKSFGGNTFCEVSAIDFKARKEAIDEAILEGAVCLDELPREFDYDELRSIFLQVADEDDKPSKKGKSPAKPVKGKKKPKPEPEEEEEDDDEEIVTAEEVGLEIGDTVEHDEWGICEIAKISKDGTSLTLEDEDGARHGAIGCEEVVLVEVDEDEDEEEEEEPPKKKPKKKAPPKKKRPKDEDEEEDDDDEEEDDPPPKKKKPAKKAPKKAPPKKGKKPKDEDEEEWDDDDEDWE